MLCLRKNIVGAIKSLISRGTQFFYIPEVKKAAIAEIRYSDVLQFYNHLLDKQGLQTNTLESVHTLLHPTFQLAVRDEIVRRNPTDPPILFVAPFLWVKTELSKVSYI